jgi:hypothetical protein
LRRSLRRTQEEETMKWTACAAVAALTVASLTAGAAPAVKGRIEKSPDVLAPAQAKKTLAERTTALPLVLAPTVLAAAPTIDDVGDVESFGKNVTYLGLAQTLPITITDDCSTSDPTLERCIVANAPPAITTFNEPGLVTMNLPAKASKSLLCFTLTPFIFVEWQNYTGAPALARFSATADITIANPLLDDPALIDPTTGAPFGGSIQVGLSTWHTMHTLQDGEIDEERSTQTRACIAGIINQRALIDTYGLTATQAKDFFKKPITLTFGTHGNVSLSAFTQYFYGFRVYGDN